MSRSAGVLHVDHLGATDRALPFWLRSHTATEAPKQGWHALQGSRMRSTKTDYVSCPSCGRTLFDLQEVTDQIRQRTGHLPGVSIAIMGCIVNGPGEMADADFG